MENNDDQPRVFDVAKPGKSEPSSTSRPVIVGHKNMIEDPMVNASASATLDDSKPAEQGGSNIPVKEVTHDDSVAPHQTKSIMPLEKIEKEEAPAAEKPSEPIPEPTTKATEPADVKENTPEPDKEPGVSDSVPDALKAKEKEDILSEEEKAQAEAIQKLIEGKHYVVHVGEVHHARLNRRILIGVLTFGFILIVAAALLLK